MLLSAWSTSAINLSFIVSGRAIGFTPDNDPQMPHRGVAWECPIETSWHTMDVGHKSPRRHHDVHIHKILVQQIDADVEQCLALVLGQVATVGDDLWALVVELLV